MCYVIVVAFEMIVDHDGIIKSVGAVVPPGGGMGGGGQRRAGTPPFAGVALTTGAIFLKSNNLKLSRQLVLSGLREWSRCRCQNKNSTNA